MSWSLSLVKTNYGSQESQVENACCTVMTTGYKLLISCTRVISLWKLVLLMSENAEETSQWEFEEIGERDRNFTTDR